MLACLNTYGTRLDVKFHVARSSPRDARFQQWSTALLKLCNFSTLEIAVKGEVVQVCSPSDETRILLLP